MNKFFLFVLLIHSISCSTIVHRKLPDVSHITLATSKIIKLSFEESLQDQEVDSILKALARGGFSKNIEMDTQIPRKFKDRADIKSFDDLFPQTNTPTTNFDLQVKLTWRRHDFYEPYCIFFLTALPCTPPYRWLIGARVVDKDGNFVKDYALTERAMGIYWLAFLNPIYWGATSSGWDELLSNILKNLMLELKKDGLI